MNPKKTVGRGYADYEQATMTQYLEAHNLDAEQKELEELLLECENCGATLRYGEEASKGICITCQRELEDKTGWD